MSERRRTQSCTMPIAQYRLLEALCEHNRLIVMGPSVRAALSLEARGFARMAAQEMYRGGFLTPCYVVLPTLAGKAELF